MCEGGPIQDDYERFEPVRSAVRENVLWSLVMLCSHGTAIMGDALEPTIRALKAVVQDDRNAVCVGFAADALTRLVNLQPAGVPMPPPIQDLRVNLMAILQSLAGSQLGCPHPLRLQPFRPNRVRAAELILSL